LLRKGVFKIDIITRTELEKRLNITRPTVIKFEKRGMPVIRVSALIRYDWHEVVGWMKEQKREVS
jgi:phage terminase Nu1 subunit (DNA packaging protein)